MAGYTAEDEQIIGQQFNQLLTSCNKICKDESDWEMVK